MLGFSPLANAPLAALGTLTANNVTYVFSSMTKAQNDNVYNGQAMITVEGSRNFVTNYFYKENF